MRLRSAPDTPGRATAGGVTLAARAVSVRRGGRVVLDAVDLDVRAGQVLMLVGPNGAGKSTLLAALAGDVAPAAGEVLLDGRPLRSWTAGQLARRRAVLPQQHAVGFSFTAGQVVRMGRAPWARTPEGRCDDDAVAEALAACDAAALAGRPFGALSGGEKARVALARVLAQRAQTLLLDEPTAALDIRHQEEVMAVARARAGSGDAVVVVVHDLALAAAHGDRVAVLDGGRLRACGAPAAVLTSGLLSQVYRHPVAVAADPVTGALSVAPVRENHGAPGGSAVVHTHIVSPPENVRE